MSAFGALRMYDGKMTVTSEQRAQNSGAIETEGGDIYITGGELTAVCKSETYLTEKPFTLTISQAATVTQYFTITEEQQHS